MHLHARRLALLAGLLSAAPLAAPAVAAQSIDTVPLRSPGDHELAIDADLSADGTRTFASHFSSSSIVALDSATGAVVDEIDLGPAAQITSSTFDEARGRLLALSNNAATLFVLQPQPLAVVSSIPVTSGPATIGSRGVIQVDDGSDTALVVGATSISIVDLAAAAEVGTIELDAHVPQFQSRPTRALLSPDGQRALVYTDVSLRARLDLVELSGGTTVQSVTLPQGASVGFAANSERSEVAIGVLRPTGVEFTVVRTSDLSLLSTTTFTNSIASTALGLDRAGTTALIASAGGSVAYRIPLGQGIVEPTDPGVVALQIEGGQTPLVDADLRAIVFMAADDRVAVVNGLTGSRTEVPLGRGGYAAARTGALSGGVAPGGARFAIASSSRDDRVAVIDVGGGSVSLLAEANTSPSLELDGNLRSALLENSGLSVVLAPGSDAAAIIDADSGAERSRVALPGRPLAESELPDGRLLIGHGNGRLALLDATTDTVTALPPLPGSIVEVEATDDPNRALVRHRDGPVDRLVLVDVTTGGALWTTILAGRMPSGSDGVTFDAAGNRAAVVSIGSPSHFDLVDVATGALLASRFTPESSFRAGVAVSPNGDRAFLATDRADVVAFDLTQAGAPIDWSIGVGGTECSPCILGSGDVRVSADGTIVYVDQTLTPVFPGPTGPGAVALDAATGQQLAAVGEDLALGFELERDVLVGLRAFAGPDLPIHRYDAQAQTFVTEVFPEPFPFFFPTVGSVTLDAARGRFACIDIDAGTSAERLVLVDLFGGRTQEACTGGVPNSTGVQATLQLGGSPFAGRTVEATVSGLQPGGMLGLLAVSDSLAPPIPIAGSQGQLCLGGSIGRFVGQIQAADAAGQQQFTVDSTAIPSAIGLAAAQPGSTYVFQQWHRDTTGGAATSNTSNAVALTFR
ncbi:MAG: PQQ-binding-like beta-propeller repeat protein [Planctomycetota bacterium]